MIGVAANVGSGGRVWVDPSAVPHGVCGASERASLCFAAQRWSPHSLGAPHGECQAKSSTQAPAARLERSGGDCRGFRERRTAKQPGEMSEVASDRSRLAPCRVASGTGRQAGRMTFPRERRTESTDVFTPTRPASNRMHACMHGTAMYVGIICTCTCHRARWGPGCQR